MIHLLIERLRNLLRSRWNKGAVTECLTALPVLRRQIHEANAQVETAVTNVCNSFQGIADRSQASVERTREILGTGGEAGLSFEQSIEASRATISTLVDRIEHGGRLAALAVQHMDEIDTTVRGMENLLDEVEKIALTSKLVALNAKIEAVHVGALGAGFEVVADEISRHAERTNELTEGISHRIGDTRATIHTATEKLRGYVQEDHARSEECRRKAGEVLETLLQSHRRAAESVELISGESTQLTGDISRAILHLQFQDRFSQRVAHVEEALEKMETLLGQSISTGAQPTSNELLSEVASSYSMQEERHAQAGLQTSAEANDGVDVELF